ncbi:50S ribosome-binding GTPase [Luteolibacter pohnpeiensis]|uniref:50S ribosome-binding GTPase n=1 Tax=Luteolibacter pohnpeiensis TaxID=454153 RepID=A0A934S630_9BACT|nr:nucleoside recognition domain-containing protein [Luteolibacter pohnpeiensis]MBK1883765.1 50S ribosome-binding GTPase [Luteolibacter pohnpeiensis]
MSELNVPSLVLAGFESSGKSSLFRGLTREASGEEANFRGSTVRCRSCFSHDCRCDVVDTPGLRLEGDPLTTRLAMDRISSTDTILLVVRGTDLQHELGELLKQIKLAGKRIAIAVTFSDKNPTEVQRLAAHYQSSLAVPVVTLDARELSPENRTDLLRAIARACKPGTTKPPLPVPGWGLLPNASWFERPIIGPLISILLLGALWALPVIAAFRLADAVQPMIDRSVIQSLTSWLGELLPPFLAAIFCGQYGLITLGWYSFLWAFPVVLFLSISTALVEQSGLQDRMIRSLDPLLRAFGLGGRDLMPVLTGYGCNVVAVQQSRACSRCTRRSCVSMITFGSACSYQIGATLSVLGASGHGLLFAPYLALLFVVSLIHTRIWNGSATNRVLLPSRERSFLQWPKPLAIWWKIKSSLLQFLFQAMPIFLLICIVGAVLEQIGLLTTLATLLSPALSIFHLPGWTAPAVVFSILRKDGLLIINQGNGSMAATLSTGQAFTLVWLAGTLTACLVTLWTVRNELGWSVAAKLAGRQALTSVIVAIILGLIIP